MNSSRLIRRVVCLVGVLSAVGIAQVRIFMAPDGEEGNVATTGNTSLYMDPGTSTSLSIWLEDTVQNDVLSFYQVFVRWDATPQSGATGTVSYRTGFPPVHSPPGGPAQASDDTATARRRSVASMAGLPCAIAADCCDLDADGVRDDECMWCSCDAGVCRIVPIVRGDVGGAFGACDPDGFTNVHDMVRPLVCSLNQPVCEGDALNLDVGGAFGACQADGFCNLSDSMHVMTTFSGTNACSCPTLPSIPNPEAGGTANMDQPRPDWVLAGSGAAFPPTVAGYASPPVETAGFGLIGAFMTPTEGVQVSGIRYLGDFQIEASADACGVFELAFVAEGGQPQGGTTLGAPMGVDRYKVNEIQNLTITVGGLQDDCVDALPAGNGQHLFATQCATTDGPTHPGSGCDQNGDANIHNDVWFLYASNCTGVLDAYTSGVNFDTRIAVYDANSGCPPTDADLIACNDNPSWLTSSVSVGVISGDSVLIRVGGAGPAEAGTGVLELSCIGSDCFASPSPWIYCVYDLFLQDGVDFDFACTDVTCDLVTGCVYTPKDPSTPCDDGNLCTINDTCSGPPLVNIGASCQGVINPCDDANDCTLDTCDVANGGDGCAHSSVIGAPCSGDAECRTGGSLTASCDIDACRCIRCQDACCDLNADATTDDVCTYCGCDAGACNNVAKTYPSDMGGVFGDCAPDGFCNLADALHALTCFSGNNPCAGINIDAGGAFGDCAPDGFCNLADALHALSCFSGDNPCACSPSPEVSVNPTVVGAASLKAVADRRAVRAGDEVSVRVFATLQSPERQRRAERASVLFRAYQLHTAVAGGRSGALELTNIEIEDRADAVFASNADTFNAFNTETSQMLAGLFDGSVATSDRVYLATFIYRVSPDAVGTFVIDVLHDGASENQTFLVGAEQTDKIEVARTVPAVITVVTESSHAVR